MDGKKKFINTRIWSDKWVQKLNPKEKLLFLYFLTSPSINLVGIYEITFQTIHFDTGLSFDDIQEFINKFDSANKIVYDQEEEYVIILNHLKHQKMNTNMKKNATKILNDLPDSIKLLYQKRCKKSEIFLRSLKSISIKKNISISFSKFWIKYDKKIGDYNTIKSMWDCLTDEEREKAYNYIDNYIQSRPDKKFRKNPESYIESKTWNDELIDFKSNTKSKEDREYIDLLNKKCEVIHV